MSVSNQLVARGETMRHEWVSSIYSGRPSLGKARRAVHLPTELLEYVFILVQQTSLPQGHVGLQLACDNALYPWPRAQKAVARARLALVCRRWRDVLHDSPRAWTDIEVLAGTTAPALRDTLARSRMMALNIGFFFTLAKRPWSSTRKLHLGVAEQCDLLREAIDILAQASSRWASLFLVAEESVVVDTLLEHLASKQVLSSLASFTVVYCGTHLYPRSVQGHHLFPPANLLIGTTPGAGGTDHAPPLQHLTLRGSRIRWREVRDVLACNITSMTLEYIYNHIKIPSFLRFLAAFIRLETLRLAGGFVKSDEELLAQPESETRAVLPALEHLTLSDVRAELATLLLQRVLCPKITSLSLDCAQWPVPFNVPDFHFFYNALACGDLLFRPAVIRTLTIRQFAIRLPIPSTFIDTNFYSPFVALTSLILDFRHLQIEFWQWLLESVAQSHLPGLTTLTVIGLSVVCVQEYVYSREQAGLSRIHLVVACDDGPFGFADDNHHVGSLAWLRRFTASCAVVTIPE